MAILYHPSLSSMSLKASHMAQHSSTLQLDDGPMAELLLISLVINMVYSIITFKSIKYMDLEIGEKK